MTKANDLASLLDANGDVVSSAMDNVPPSNDASALSTGTLPDGRFPAVLPAVSGANLTGIPTPTLTSLGIPNHNQVTVDGSGNVSVTGTVDGRDVATDGTKLDGIEALADVTDTANVTAAGALMTTGGSVTGNINFGNNNKAIFGAGTGDFEIYSDGTYSRIMETGGQFLVLDTNGSKVSLTSDNSKVMGDFIKDGAVQLHHNGFQKFSTTATGVSVTGTVAATAFSGDGSNLTNLPVSTPTLSSLGIANHNQLTVASNGNVTVTGTGAITVPSGTTAQRPSSPVNGMIRRNTTDSVIEVYNNNAWQNVSTFTSVSAQVLTIAGGGSGAGRYYGGGGGAGGVVAGSYNLRQGSSYAVTVGAGAASVGSFTDGLQGSNSTVTGDGISVNAVGGGAGIQSNDGGSGGSGGGAASSSGSSGGSGTSGQGNAGGNGSSASAGGGGGYSEAGNTDGQGYGGDGASFTTYTNNSDQFAGGGGGAMNANASYFVAQGGTGGGGNAAADYLGGAVSAQAGTANTGGGGGGACWNNTTNGAAGGSGVVFVKIPTASFSGTHTASSSSTSGGYTYLKFTSSGSFTV